MWKCWLSKYGILKNQYIGDYFGGIVNKKRGELPHYKAISNLFSPFPSQDINSKFSAFLDTLKSQGQEAVKHRHTCSYSIYSLFSTKLKTNSTRFVQMTFSLHTYFEFAELSSKIWSKFSLHWKRKKISVLKKWFV